MSNRILVLFFAILAVQTSFGQNMEKIFGKRRETYFSFRITSKAEIQTLTNVVSIDNVKGDTVWAYANMPEFIRFMKLGYPVTLLPHPGDGPGIVMTSHIPLNANTTWNYYPTYTAYVDLMNQFQATYPAICQVQTIATLASGRKIMIAKISDNVATNEAEPEFLYTSSIHGDETTGYILMLHLMDYLLSNYGSNAEVTDLVNNMEIYINPLANPDGTYFGGNGSVTGAQRYNANGIDLNRNYPDLLTGDHPDGNAWQPETVAFMDFATQHHFAASCNFHGGIEVVNYPWDTWYTLNADDNWFQFVSREYADTVHQHSPSTYMDDLTNGITNGAVWYIVHGGRQDYMNYWHHCKEITIELSNVKLLPAAQLETHWNYNWRSLIRYMKQARYGIHGLITDLSTGNPVAARVYINGHDLDGSECYSSASPGDYHRLLKAGTYTLEISAQNYQAQTITNVVVSAFTATSLNIQMTPCGGISTFPWNEGFENAGAIPNCWTNEQVNSSGIYWTFITGNGGANPGSAHTGTYNACLKDNTTADNKTRLIAPSLNLSSLLSPQLKFWHTQALWSPDQDKLSVFYRTSATGTWTTLATYSTNISSWTQETINLPNPGGDYYIAFEGNAKYGYGACLDDVSITGTQKTLSVTPASQGVTASAGSVAFSVASNTAWTAVSNQSWCVVTSSGSGNGTITASYSQNTATTSRVAAITVTVNGLSPVVVTVTQAGVPDKVLNLTVFLEGLFNGTTMNKAKNALGDQFPGNVADQVTLELHHSTSPFAIAGGPYTINAGTNGTASATIPASLGASYYLVIKHRNSIETWSSGPVSFSGATVNYNFSSQASQAYGNNLKQVSDKFVLYAGDVNQDGAADAGDLVAADNAAAAFTTGYVASDVNGDGVVNFDDILLLLTNSSLFAKKVTP